MNAEKGKVVRQQTYVGIDIPHLVIEPYRKKLAEILGEQEFARIEENKFERDGENHWHITLLIYKEYRKLSREEKKLFHIGKEIEYRITGIGAVSVEDSTAYFATVEIPVLVGVQESLNMETHRDYHITLGYTKNDIHGVDKSGKTRIWNSDSIDK